MGPLYHLLKEEERIKAINAAMNVLKPGGIIYVSFINVFSGMIYYMKYMPDIETDPVGEEFVAKNIAGESYSGHAFTQVFFIDVKQVLPFMAQFPLEKMHYFGQEGVTAPCEQNIMAQSQDVINKWLDFSEAVWEREELLNYSEHLMYVGKKHSPISISPEEEQAIQNHIAYYNAQPCTATGHIDVPYLSDGEIYLVCTEKCYADFINLEKDLVPQYRFAICKNGEKIGGINLRTGYAESLFYGGQIGYNIDEAHRGHSYAEKACRLLAPVAKAHNMTKLLITNQTTNPASMRVCEKLGAKLICTTPLPHWTDMYKRGQRLINVYEWTID